MSIPVEVTLGNQSVIPISVQLTTNTGQFTVGMLIALVGAVGFIFFIYLPAFIFVLKKEIVRLKLKAIYQGTGRRALLVNHNMQMFLNVQMITMDTAYRIADAMSKFKGASFDLILNTLGGEVYATQFISRLLRGYHGKVRAVIPMMAASGGTLLALSCSEISMSGTAVLGPVDPQLGTFWDMGSARSWKEVLNKKGRKSDDSSIRNAFLGAQVTKTMSATITDLLVTKHRMRRVQANALAKRLTDGGVEHIFQIDWKSLVDAGLCVGHIDAKTTQLYHQILKRKTRAEVVVV